MKNLFLSLVMAAVGLGFTQASSAAVTSYPCHGCTPAQEEQAALAKPGIGIRYVHNFTQRRIRKFAVVLATPQRTSALSQLSALLLPAIAADRALGRNALSGREVVVRGDDLLFADARGRVVHVRLDYAQSEAFALI